MKWVKNNCSLFVGSVLSALAVTMDLNVADAPEAGITIGLYQQIYKLITIAAADITGKGFLLSILTLLFFGGYWYIWSTKFEGRFTGRKGKDTLKKTVFVVFPDYFRCVVCASSASVSGSDVL